MAKINVYFGTMGSGKSLDLIRTVYNYKERGMDVLVYKPTTDTREGKEECIIKTRVGMEVEALWIEENADYGVYDMIRSDCITQDITPSAIIVDECQFLTEEQVNDFQKFSLQYNIPIIFYGLKVDFTSHLFEGSKRILEIADRVVELKSICHCGQIARQNARIINGEIQRDGNVIEIGGNELYMALCNKCYKEGRIK